MSTPPQDRPRTVVADEREMAAALGQLAEAVIVQRRDGRLAFANSAALRMLGFASLDEILRAEPASILDAYELLHPDGRLVHRDELPGRRVLRGEEPEPLLVRAVQRETGWVLWSVVKASALHDEAGGVSGAVSVIEDVTQVRQAELTQRLLAGAGELLGAAPDREDALGDVARLLVPDLADGCTIDVLDSRGTLDLAALAHADPERERQVRDLRDAFPVQPDRGSGIAEVLRTGRTELLTDLDVDLREGSGRGEEELAAWRRTGVTSVLVVPLRASGRVIGTLALALHAHGRRFTPADVALAEELGRRIGVAVHNARLYAERGRIAHVLQASLLPGRLPEVPGFETAALFRPAGEANEVGGDFYDVQQIDGSWLLMVGDVTGKGATAAALTPRVRHTVATATSLAGDLLVALAHLNRVLLREPSVLPCTMAAGVLEGDRIALVCAGHPAPLLVRDGRARPLAVTGPLLGVREDAEWRTLDVTLAAGDALVLYTDGVTDASGGGERFGRERLLAALAGSGPLAAAALVHRVGRALDAFQTGPQRDDIAVLAVTRR